MLMMQWRSSSRSKTTLEQSHGPPPSWILQDRVGYIPSPNSTTRLTYGDRLGDWHRVDISRDETPVTLPVFELIMDHGPVSKFPSTDILPSAYYTVLPDVDQTKLAALVSDDPISVLANSPSLQAVHHAPTSLTGASFYEPGELVVRTGFTVKV